MSGHSHAANIKHKKDRHDKEKSSIFIKVRKQAEQIIREEKEINEKVLLLAKKHNFSKDKLIKILESIKKEENDKNSWNIYIGLHKILIAVNGKINNTLVKKLNLELLNNNLFHNFFLFSISFNDKTEQNKEEIEEYLLSLDNNDLKHINYNKNDNTILSSSLQIIEKFLKEKKDIFNDTKIILKSILSVDKNAIREEYLSKIEYNLKDYNFITNISN